MLRPPCILVIDDEKQILRFLRISLRSEGYHVLEAETGTAGLALAATEKPDVIVLDLGLPDIDGEEVLNELREWSSVPVLVLSVRNTEQDKVHALDSGANDYVCKPFGIKEFMARIRVLLREKQTPLSLPDTPVYRSDQLTIDFSRRRVTLTRHNIGLSKKEYALLTMLAKHADHVVTQQHLLSTIWGESHRQDTHYLRIFIGRLRNKLGDDPAAPHYIITEPGVGYRLITHPVDIPPQGD